MLTQCPTNVNLNKFKLKSRNNSEVYTQPKSQVYSWIRHAITRNVQEVDLLILDGVRYPEKFSYDDELFFNNSCLMSMKLSHCVFNPPNGAIRWEKLKCLCIDYGRLDEDSIIKILSGSPCLETLKLKHCNVVGRIPKSLFGNFGVEQLSCGIKTYESLKYGDELFFDSYSMSMKLSRYIFPPNGAILLYKLKFLCIERVKLVEDSIGKILSGSPCLETLELKYCYGVRRIDVTSESVKNLVLFGCDFMLSIDTIEINAPYILSLTIKESFYVEKILLLNVCSLVKADLNYNFSEELVGEHVDEIEEELLRGLLASLDHVNEIPLGYSCLEAFSRLEAKGFQFRKGSDRRINPHGYLVFYKQV